MRGRVAGPREAVCVNAGAPGATRSVHRRSQWQARNWGCVSGRHRRGNIVGATLPGQHCRGNVVGATLLGQHLYPLTRPVTIEDKVRACGLFAKGYDTAAPSTPQQELTPLHEWRVLTCVAFMQGAVAIPPTGARVGVGREARPRLEVRVLPGAASRVWCRPASGTRVRSTSGTLPRGCGGGAGQDRDIRLRRSAPGDPGGVEAPISSRALQAGACCVAPSGTHRCWRQRK